MSWLKQKLSKYKTRKFYIKCLNMYKHHSFIASNTGSPTEYNLSLYWHKRAEEAWKEYAQYR